MATIKPLFAAIASILGGGVATWLNSLANLSTATSDAVDNSANLYDTIWLELYIDGTAAAGAWLDVRVLPCIDGTNYASWESGIILDPVLLDVDLQRHVRCFKAPQRWKLAVKNNTGAGLAAAANTAKYQGENPQVV